jgi:hypothetical protein
MGPLGVPNAGQPRGAATVLTAPEERPAAGSPAAAPAPVPAVAVPPGLIPRQPGARPEPPGAPVWPDNPQPVDPGHAPEPPNAAGSGVPWLVPAPSAAPPPGGGPPGQLPPPGAPAPPISPAYPDWARQQLAPANVYGVLAPGQVPGQAHSGYEASGSLSGQILGDGATDDSRRGSKAVIIIMVIMAVVVAGGLAAAVAYLSGVFH